MISGDLQALRFALGRQANAYGFTLIVWGTGAVAAWQLGRHDPAEVFAHVGGAPLSVSLIVALVFGVRRPFSAMHLLSLPAAIAAGRGLVAVGLHQALLSAEGAAALAPEDEGGSLSRGERA